MSPPPHLSSVVLWLRGQSCNQ